MPWQSIQLASKMALPVKAEGTSEGKNIACSLFVFFVLSLALDFLVAVLQLESRKIKDIMKINILFVDLKLLISVFRSKLKIILPLRTHDKQLLRVHEQDASITF
jgi:hypothetical protein